MTTEKSTTTTTASQSRRKGGLLETVVVERPNVTDGYEKATEGKSTIQIQNGKAVLVDVPE